MSKHFEIHLLHNVPSSNLNRDEQGSPKTMVFGGVTRGRISSQAQKRAVRESELFKRLVESQLGVRTRNLPKLLLARLEKAGLQHPANSVVVTALANFFGKVDEAKAQLKTLIFLDPQEIEDVHQVLIDNLSELQSLAPKESDKDSVKKKAMEQLNAKIRSLTGHIEPKVSAPDISLFGRMVAELDKWDVDGATSVMHAMGINRDNTDYDFFVAVDDVDQSVGMLDNREFNSNVYYRYATVDFDQLLAGVQGDVEQALKFTRAFLQAFAMTLPSGSQRTHAAYTLPDLVVVTCREDAQPINMANAFLTPVRAQGDKNTVMAGIEAFEKHWNALHEVFGPNGLREYATVTPHREHVKTLQNLTDLPSAIHSVVR